MRFRDLLVPFRPGRGHVRAHTLKFLVTLVDLRVSPEIRRRCTLLRCAYEQRALYRAEFPVFARLATDMPGHMRGRFRFHAI